MMVLLLLWERSGYGRGTLCAVDGSEWVALLTSRVEEFAALKNAVASQSGHV